MKLTKIIDTLWLDLSTVTAIDADAEPYFVVIYTTTREHHVPIGHLDKVLHVLGATEPTCDTFTAHGLTWRKHTPGDLMPCDGYAKVRLLMEHEMCGEYFPHTDSAKEWNWGCRFDNPECRIIGWNYADMP